MRFKDSFLTGNIYWKIRSYSAFNDKSKFISSFLCYQLAISISDVKIIHKDLINRFNKELWNI